jgi:transposase InsO family protein
MVIHKRTRLTPIQREEIYRSYHGEGKKVSELAEAYHVSRPTIYKIIRRGRQQDFSIHKSTTKRLPLVKGESSLGRREYLFVAIDDFSRELYAAILPEKTQNSSKEFWHQKTLFSSSAHRKNELRRFINFYNGVKPHKGIGKTTPEEKLIQYFYPEKL